MKRVALALAFIFWASAAFAQYSGLRVVQTCGTPTPWSALDASSTGPASVAWMTVDQNYVLCVNATLSGTITIGTVAQGASGSAADGWYVRPGTGASWVLGAGSAAIGSITNTGFTALQAGAANTSGNPFFVQCVGGTCSGGGGGTTGFTPSFSYSTPLAVTNTSASTTLPAGTTTGSVVKVYNRGPAPIFWTAGPATPSATTSMSQLAPNCWDSFIVPAGTTNIAAITSASTLTATLNTEVGAGQPAGGCGPSLIAAFGVTAPTNGVAVGFKSSTGTLVNPVLDASGNIQVSGAVTASFSQFTPNGNVATITGGTATGSTNVTLPLGVTVKIDNTDSTNAVFVKLGTGAATATTNDFQVAAGGYQCVGVGSNTSIAAITAASTAKLNLQGGSGGCAGSGGGGGGGGSSAAADTTLASTGTVSTANVFGTGLTVASYLGGKTVLTGTPTANSALSFTGFTGWNAGTLECTDSLGTNNYEVDASYSASVWKRADAWTGPAYSQTFNLAAVTVINVVADKFAASTLACGLRVSVSVPGPDPSQSQLSGNLSNFKNLTGTGLTEIVPLVPGQAIYVTGWDEFVTDATTGSPVWTWSYGTGTNCGTGTTAVRANRNFVKNNGIVGGGGPGQEFTVPPGNALCANVTTAPTGGAVGLDVTYAQR